MTLRIGCKGETIRALQAKLNALGYHLAEDGIFGYGTLQAVRDFQRRKRIVVDGMVGPQTMAQITLAMAAPKPPGTTHFKVANFISPNDAKAMAVGVPSRYYKNLKNLMTRLEKVQEKIGGIPLIIRSGYRSPAHNRAVGGAARSQHLYAKAADIYVQGYAISTYDLAKAIFEDAELKALFGGYGLGSNTNLHVDIRESRNPKKPTVWWYGHKSWEAWERAK